MPQDSSVYSYHTFILPFVWKCSKRVQSDLAHFAEIFEKNAVWEDTNIYDGLKQGQPLRVRDKEEALSFYKEYQFFFPNVRNALYGFDHLVVRNFTFMQNSIQNKAEYIITKGSKDYILVVNAINLKIYNTGIALFILECENRGGPENRQRNLAAVKAINEYGRRISLPFLPTQPDFYSICADRQTIRMGNVSFSTDYLQHASNLHTKQEIIQKESVTYISHFIKEILGYGNLRYHFTSDEETSERDPSALYIFPALDDRMFVQCFVNDPAETHRMLNRPDTENEPYAFQTDAEVQKSLYEFIFVDLPGDCSCQTSAMREDLIESHLYSRWLDYGTIYAICAQSFVCLSSNPPYHLIETFLTQYSRMVCIGLAQRATLAFFERELSELTIESLKSNGSLKNSAVTRIMGLRQRFSTYQSQLGFEDVSSQEQAIELWDHIKDVFRIQKNMISLSERMEGLHEASNTNLNYTLNILGLIITLFTVMETVGDVIAFHFDSTNDSVTSRIIGAFLSLFGAKPTMQVAAPGTGLRGMYIGIHLMLYLVIILFVMYKYRRRK